jgi:predicted RND superfamily exporter protein
VPCLLTSLTTAAGFIALIVNQNLPIRYFGVYCAFACLLEWVVIFYLLPPVLKIFGFSAPSHRISLEGWTRRYVDAVRKNARAIVALSASVVVLGGITTTWLRVDDNFFTKFKAGHPLSRAVDAFSRHFQFVGSIDLILKPKYWDILDAENLARIREIEKKIAALPEVSRVSSLRQLNDDLLTELALRRPGEGEKLRRSVLNLLDDYGALKDLYSPATKEARTVVFLKSLSTDDFDRALADIAKVKAEAGDKISIEVAGFSNIRSFINSRVIQDLFRSFSLSFFLTYLCFLFLYRSAGWAFLALLPNAIPLVAITGLMGLFGVPVDSNLAIMICVAFGISGDNTIHLTYVTRQNRGRASNYLEGLLLAVRQIGVPIIATSAVFVVCLPCFLLGHLRLFDEMAIFLTLAFVMAFFSDLFSFPALHVLLRKKV